MMNEKNFLAGEELTKSIRWLVEGDNVKCAVAYWGKHHFERDENWKIVCDIVGGSTSADTLQQLGAPNNSNLKHVNNFHAKVYISDRGVIVGSANASAGGLDHDGQPARLLEAGTFHEARGEVWQQSTEWFDNLFSNARVVDAAALEIARQAYRPPASPFTSRIDGEPMDFLDLVRLRPEKFSDNEISFVFCEGGLTDQVYEDALEDIAANGEKEEILSLYRDWHKDRRFVNFNIDAIRSFLIIIYLGRGGRNLAYKQKCGPVLRSSDGNTTIFLTESPDRENTFKEALGGAKLKPTDDRWKFVREIVFGREREKFHDQNDEFGVVISANDLADILRKHT